jgi:hypothetical protein
VDYDDYQTANAPTFLGGENGTLWNRVLGIVKDAVVEAAKSAVRARFADKAGPDSLVYLLEDRNLDPAWNENETSVRARVKNAWATWENRDTVAGMSESLTLAGYTNFEIVERPADETLQWWEFDIVVKPPFPWVDTSLSDSYWDAAGLWNDGGSWAEAVPADHLARLRLIAKKKSSHARCRWIVVRHLIGETWDGGGSAIWDDDPTALWFDQVSYISP